MNHKLLEPKSGVSVT